MSTTTTNRVKFEQLCIGSYAGMTDKTLIFADAPELTDKPKLLDHEQGIVLFFPEGLKYVEANGDQEVGKTSLLSLIRELGGEEPPVNAVNTDTKTKKVEFRFWGKDGNYYHLAMTRTEVKLYRVDTDEEGKPIMRNGKEVKAEVKQPKQMLKALIGPVGTSPMALAQMDGAEQIEWLRKMSNDPTSKEEEKKLQAERKVIFKERTAKNNEVKTYKNSLVTNDYYKDMDTWQQYFVEEAPRYANVEEHIKGIQERYELYQQIETQVADKRKAIGKAQQQMEDAKEDIADMERQILELQRRIAVKADVIATTEITIQEVEATVTEQEKWLSDNVAIQNDYTNLTEISKDATEFKLQQQAFSSMLAFKSKMDAAQEQANKLTEQINEKDEAITNLVARFTPQIPEFAAYIPNEDEQQYKHGLFYKGKPLSHLAESALWEMYTLLCQYYDIRIIIVENISSLGTGSIEKFNEFLQNGGCYIFGAAMKRRQEKLGVIFHFLIP